MPSLCLTDGACRHTFADTLQHPVYLTLASQTSVRSIKVGVLGDAWPGADREEFPLGVEVPGSITKWIVTAEGRLTIEWPDGTDNHFLGDLLAPELKFRVISNKDGGREEISFPSVEHVLDHGRQDQLRPLPCQVPAGQHGA